MKKKIKSIDSNTITLSQTSLFSGPLPPPSILEGYERLLKGSASRILSMAEKQSDHRIELEKKVIYSNILNERLGIISSLIISTLLIIVGGFLIYSDKDGIGLITVLTPIIINITLYILNKQKELKVEKKEP